MSGEPEGVVRRLWLIRHAEAAPTSASGDRGRPLSSYGEEQARRVGRFLAGGPAHPDWIVSSDATRAADTARLIAAALAPAGEVPLLLDSRLYLATPDTLLDVVREMPPAQDAVAVVAHNPGLSDFVALLAGRPAPAMSTGDVAEFEVPDDWPYLGAGSARLVRIVSAHELPPGPNTTGVVPWSS